MIYLMRILFFNYEYPPLGGGAANATFYLMRELSQMEDVFVDVVTSSIDNNYHLENLGTNVTIHRLPIGKNPANIHYQSKKELIAYTWKAYWFARKLVKANQYDLTHSFFSVPCGFLSLLLKFEHRLPYIVSLRGSDVPYYSERFTLLYKFITPLIRFIWNQAHFVIANSMGLKELANRSRPKREIGVIYNGIDIDEFYPRPDLQAEHEVRMICGTRVTPRKGIRFLIQAVDMLIKKYPNVRLSIVGEGDEKQSLMDLARGLGLGNAVTFLGYVPRERAAQVYAQAHVYVSPSFNEGMANFMLECMALGMPIVATDVGGTRELLEENKNGLIIKVGDAQDIFEKIESLLQDPQLLKSMSKESRAKAEQMSWQNVARQYRELYVETKNLVRIHNEKEEL